MRQLSAQGQVYTIVHKGDASRGSVVLKLNLGRTEGCRLLTQAYGPDGQPGWLPALEGRLVPETEADAYLQRLIASDADAWVVEIDSRDGSHPFPGRIIE